MKRPVTLALLCVLTVSMAGLGANGGTQRPKTFLTMAQLASVYGNSFDLPKPPEGQSPRQRAHWVLEERPMLGRTPMSWARWANETFRLDASAAAPDAASDLVTGVARIYGALGLPVTPALTTTLQLQASKIPAALRAPFAGVVSVVADAYVAQAPITVAVAARVRDGIDPHETLLMPAERDMMAAAEARILDAISVFNVGLRAWRDAAHIARTPNAPQAGGSDQPLFSDPEGLVILGGIGNATYTRAGLFPDPVLLIEPDGTDLYRNSAGGACPVWEDIIGDWMECNLLAVSVVADLGEDSDDDYIYNGPPAAVQGAGGPAGLGLLVDAGGDDLYDAKMTRAGTEPFFQYFDGGAQGFGYSGVGVQLDEAGDDIFRFAVTSNGPPIWALGQGFGGGGGLGISSDVQGQDDWLTYASGNTYSFNGIYTDGVGFYGGVGIMTDTGMGADVYDSRVTASSVDYYAQGFGAFGGLGVMYEDGGNDSYYTYEEATAPFNPDLGQGGPVIDPVLNCAFGTASFGAVGAMIELGGNDRYVGKSKSTMGATVMDSGFGGPSVAYGVFFDAGGTDHYEMSAVTGGPQFRKKIAGRGLYEPGTTEDPVSEPVGTNSWGAFVDIGGTDTYIPSNIGGNNTVWSFGADWSV